MNTKLIEKLRNGEVAIEFDNEEDGLLELSQVLKAAFPEDKNTGLTDHYRYYYRLTPKQWYCSTLHLPEGMAAYPLKDFLEEDKDKYSLKSVFDEARKVLAKENGKYHSKEYTELLERIKPKENKNATPSLSEQLGGVSSSVGEVHDNWAKNVEEKEDKQPEINPVIIWLGSPLAEVPVIINKPISFQMQWDTLEKFKNVFPDFGKKEMPMKTTFTQLLAEEIYPKAEYPKTNASFIERHLNSEFDENVKVSEAKAAAEKYADLKMAELAEWLGNKKVHFDGSHWYFIADAKQTTAELIQIFNAENNGR